MSQKLRKAVLARRSITCQIDSARRKSLHFLALAVLGAGCGSHTNPLSSQTDPVPPQITVSCPAQVRLATTTTCTASVIGESNAAVTWSIQPPTGTPASAIGSISSSGVYTAPPVGDAPVMVTIVAASVAQPSITASTSVQLLNPTPLIATATIAAATGAETLSISGSGFLPSSTVSLGTTIVTPQFISANALQMVLPPSVLATSQIPVTVNNPNPGAITSNIVTATIPAQITVTGPAQVRLTATATYTASVIGESNAAVTWSVQPPTGTAASAAGSISASGVYTAPPVGDAPVVVTIVATSVAQPTATTSASVQLLNPAPQISTATIAATTGAETLSISGSGFLPGSTVSLGTTIVTPQFISANALQVALPPSMLAISLIPVTVNNPNPGAIASNIVNATVPAQIIVTGPTQVQRSKLATYSASATGLANQGVTWSVLGPGPNQNVNGQISAMGVYTPPSFSTIETRGEEITIVATSVAQPFLHGSLSVQLLDPTPQITAANVSVGPSANYLISVAGMDFAPDAVIYLGTRALQTNYLSPSLVTSSVLQPAISTTQVQISVNEPSDGGSASNSVTASVTPPATSVLAASRLLDQTTFGPTLTDIGHLQSIGISEYLREQFTAPPSIIPPMSSHYSDIPAYCGPFGQCEIDGHWWDNILFGPDQLRQRVAFALSEIWVVSWDASDARAGAPYLNALTNDAFGNYRQLMSDIATTAAMGQYLNMANNLVTPASLPNQNFARENLQLFNIGLFQLNDDGTQQLDSNGNPIPTYSEAQVEAFSLAFSGWTYGNPDCSTATSPNPGPPSNGVQDYLGNNCPLSPLDAYHDHSSKTLLDGVVLPAGQHIQQDFDAALDNVFNSASLPPFVCRQLIQRLVKSAPSPSYLSRVVQVFKDDGTGVRGNLEEVVSAILTDPEARAADVQGGQTGTDGHQREPILWLTANLRALQATRTGDPGSYDLVIGIGKSLEEPTHSAPSVFGFFSPQFVIPQTTINAPEFEIETSASIVYRRNLTSYYILNDNMPGITYDLSSTGFLGELAVAGPQDLTDWVNVAYFHGNMSSQEQSIFIHGLQGLLPQTMVNTALYTANTASAFTVIQ
jgi:uncharacterized protein (DUF1800 family)